MSGFKAADMKIVYIESNDALLRDQTTTQVAQKLREDGFRVRVAAFPGDGPFAHQIRVALDQRTEYQELPWHSLQLVDRMDFFFNPNNGLLRNNQKFDFLILSGSHYHELLHTDGETLSAWVLSINGILPPPDFVFWLSGPQHDPFFERLIHTNPSARMVPSVPPSSVVDIIYADITAEEDHE